MLRRRGALHLHRDRVVAASGPGGRGNAPGPRRRDLRGRAAQFDMALPVVGCALLGLVLLAAGLATLLPDRRGGLTH